MSDVLTFIVVVAVAIGAYRLGKWDGQCSVAGALERALEEDPNFPVRTYIGRWLR